MNLKRIRTIVTKDALDGIRDGRILIALVLPFAFALFFDATWSSSDTAHTAMGLSEQGQHAVMMLIPTIFLIILIAVFVVPVMLAEEAEKKTLDVLVMISSYWEVVTAKAIVGVLYVAVALGVMLRLTGLVPENIPLFALATTLLTITLIVIGLLIGGFFRNANQLNTWSAVILMPLMIPTIFVPGAMTGLPELPSWGEIALDANPVSHGLQVMIDAVTGEQVFDETVRSLGIVLAWGVVGYLALLWTLHRRRRTA